MNISSERRVEQGARKACRCLEENYSNGRHVFFRLASRSDGKNTAAHPRRVWGGKLSWRVPHV